MLKTDRPRKVPVHRDLAFILDLWKREGFELVYLRAPEATDYIVPRTDADREPLTNSAVYRGWKRTLARAGVTNRSVHSTRHTFLTLARRGGAAKDVIERVTHNAEGEMVDHYTHWDWEPLCEAVMCLPSLLTGTDALPDDGCTENTGSGGRTRTSATAREHRKSGATEQTTGLATSAISRENEQSSAELEARQDYPGLTPAELADCRQILADLRTALSQRPGLARCSAAAWSLAAVASWKGVVS